MEEDSHPPPPPKRSRRTDPGGDGGDHDDGGDHGDDNDDVKISSLLDGAGEEPFLPVEMIGNILTFLDVRTLVEIKVVSRQFQHLSTTAIDNKGVGTTRKMFETNKELRAAVKRYCPLPQRGNTNTTTQQYCDREVAEEIVRLAN